MSDKKVEYRLTIVDGDEYGDTLVEMFSRAAQGTWLECENLTLGQAWIELGLHSKKADAVLVHGSIQGEGFNSANVPRTGVELAKNLKAMGYQVNVLTAGGSRDFELKGFEKESGVAGFTHNDIQVILKILSIASR
ncbi:MAG: hypothetical protein WCG44_01625 [bacterium]